MATDDFAGLVVDYDLVIAHRPDDTEHAPGTEVRVTPLLREPLDVAVSLDHRLAGRAQVEPGDLVGESWIAPPPEFPIEQAVRALAARAGAPARIVRRTTHLPLMEGLVARGQGIALLPRYSTQGHAAGRFVLVPVTGIRAGRLIEALSRPGSGGASGRPGGAGRAGGGSGPDRAGRHRPSDDGDVARSRATRRCDTPSGDP